MGSEWKRCCSGSRSLVSRDVITQANDSQGRGNRFLTTGCFFCFPEAEQKIIIPERNFRTRSGIFEFEAEFLNPKWNFRLLCRISEFQAGFQPQLVHVDSEAKEGLLFFHYLLVRLLQNAFSPGRRKNKRSHVTATDIFQSES